MIVDYIAKKGYWLWNYTETIGQWDFQKSWSYAEDKDEEMRRLWIEIPDSEKTAKEAEQEEWRKEQEPTSEINVED